MKSRCIALTALTSKIRFEELSCVAAALQRQVIQDFAPAWGVSAVIAAVPPEAIPAGYDPIFIQDSLDAVGANGYHRAYLDDSPYAIVPWGRNWSLAAGHELLRMLADPTGSARLPGPSCLSGQGVVEYLLDVSAPCGDIAHAYAIDGLVVPDFCLPSFFNERGQGSCSFTGALRHPFRPAAGGVVTWLADDGLLYQARCARQQEPKVVGGFSCASRGRLLMRELADMQTPRQLLDLADAPTPARLRDAQQNAKRARLTNLMRFRDDIGWRFGQAHVTAEIETGHAYVAAHRHDYAPAGPGQYPVSEEFCTTEKTAS